MLVLLADMPPPFLQVWHHSATPRIQPNERQSWLPPHSNWLDSSRSSHLAATGCLWTAGPGRSLEGPQYRARSESEESSPQPCCRQAGRDGTLFAGSYYLIQVPLPSMATMLGINPNIGLASLWARPTPTTTPLSPGQKNKSW